MPIRKWLTCSGALALAGCGGQAPQAPVVEAPGPVLVAQVSPPARPVPPLAALVPAAPALPKQPAARAFRFPDDVGGKKVAATLTPSVPSVPPMPRVSAPKPHSSAIDRGEIPLPRITSKMPRLPLPPAKATRPGPPPERVPNDLGQAAAENAAAVRLSVTPVERAPAAAELTPGDLPPLAQQLPGRAPLDDPTAELSAARVVFTKMAWPVVRAAFARFGIPDPFEFAAHLRGKTAVGRELGVTPVDVPPGRP
jgi:hypothetical protein